MNNDILLLAALGMLINAVILYIIIASATRAKQRGLYDWAQMELLAKIARAQGVPEEEVNSVIEMVK